ncbi:protein SIEVE ELEMENT OCCLUSION B-like [Senna tora]|uniref:Protein SIEVE ELEMENT OCCLUSION B-like n=1 Tax=Senna tora TaxID=362788 RepID=A0A834W2L4_9FABA|nr:protein SIEVE ELEMENT OCCLUSION B-like [Senna tora]
MSTQQTPSLKPLTLSDGQILELVLQYCTVVNKHGDTFNVDLLFDVVSDIMKPSLDNDATPPHHPSPTKTDECKDTKIEPPVQTLKHIACQMMQTADDEDHSNAHLTTMCILEELRGYSWDAKAVIALAAFSLEYGNFWHLSKLPREDDLGRSLALLNNVQLEEEEEAANNNNNNICEYNLLVKTIFEAVKSMVELEKMVKKQVHLQGYDDDDDDVPSLKEAMHDFPVFVYWVVLAIVASALHLNFLSNNRKSKYELFNISSKISNVHSKLRALLGIIRKEIAQKDEYLKSHKELQTPIDEVAEIFLEGSDYDLPQ